MKLYSGFKDYYDVIQRMDLDPRPAYVRKNNIDLVIFKDKAKMASFGSLSGVFKMMPMAPKEAGTSRLILGFCGRLIPLYLHGRQVYDSIVSVLDRLREPPDPEVEDQTHNYRSRLWNHKRLIQVLDKETRRDTYSDTRWGFHPDGWKGWLAGDGALLQGEHDEIFRMVGAPIFLWRGRWMNDEISHQKSGIVLEKNPSLKYFGYQRFMEPYEVWQSIDQYLGNQMAKQEDPSPLSDELRRDAHGFDDRSFKAIAPSEKKARRKRNRKNKNKKTSSDY